MPHSEFLSHSPSGRTAIVYQPNESFSIIDLLLVTELEVHAASSEGLSPQGAQGAA